MSKQFSIFSFQFSKKINQPIPLLVGLLLFTISYLLLSLPSTLSPLPLAYANTTSCLVQNTTTNPSPAPRLSGSYFNGPTLAGSGSFLGLITAKGRSDIDKFGSTTGVCALSQVNRSIIGYIPTYSDLYNRFYVKSASTNFKREFTSSVYDNSITDLANTDTLYHIAGDLRLLNPLSGTKTGVFFVDGNLTIGQKGQASAYPYSGSLVFIVGGNVNIDSGATSVDGVFIVGGTFCSSYNSSLVTCVASSTPATFTINGAVISLSGSLAFTRLLPADGSPGEKIVYQPKYLPALKDLFSESKVITSEIANSAYPQPQNPLTYATPYATPYSYPTPYATPVFSNLSASLTGTSATFNFAYSGSTPSYIVDMSTTSNMATDVYLSFGTGSFSPITVSNPTKWDKYFCGNTLYWRVYNSDNSITSPIQTSIISGAGCPAATPSPPPPPAAVAWWKFDECFGTTAADSSGNGNTGTLVNSPQWVTGKVGGCALSFNGSNTYVSAGAGPSLNLTGSFTVTAWINPNSFGGNSLGRIFNKTDCCSGYGWMLDNLNRPASMGLLNQNASYGCCGSIITLNSWQHVAASYDTSTQIVSYYVNGILIGTASYPIPVGGTAPFIIGNRLSLDRGFSGTIDDLRVYNSAFTQTQIQNIYQGIW